jgi:hypothetical protein
LRDEQLICGSNEDEEEGQSQRHDHLATICELRVSEPLSVERSTFVLRESLARDARSVPRNLNLICIKFCILSMISN